MKHDKPATLIPPLNEIMSALETEGFILIPSLISGSILAEAQATIKLINEQERLSGKEQEPGQIRSFGLAIKHSVFRNMVSHPLIVSIWQNYLSEDTCCSSFSSNTMLPYQGGMYWHVDYPYWSIKQPWPCGTLTGQTLWMLDDFTIDNGATALIPRSHMKGSSPTINRKAPSKDQWVVEGKAGSVLLFDGRLWHSTRPNNTEKSRIALFCMYIRSCMIPMEAMNEQLAALDNPSDLEIQLFGGKQREPSKLVEALERKNRIIVKTDGLGNKI